MSHPTPESWMEFLYEEMAPPARQEFEAHLGGCAACREELARLRATRQALDRWQVSRQRASLARWQPLVRWGIAASFMGLLAAGGWRLQALQAEMGQLRSEVQAAGRTASPVAPEIFDVALAASRSSLTAEFSAALRATEERWTAAHEATLAALRQFEAGQLAAYAGLREELETVAVLTENGLARTQEELLQVASYAQPASSQP